MDGNTQIVVYDQSGLTGDDLRSLIAPPAAKPAWQPIDLKDILAMYHEAGGSLDLVSYIRTIPQSDNERGLVFYLDSLRHGSYNTVELYARYVAGFLNFCRKPFHAANYIDVRDYLQSFKDPETEEASPSTISTILAALRSFYKMMHGSGVTAVNPTALVKVQKVHRSDRVARTVLKATPSKELAAHKKHLRENAPLRDLVIVTIMSSMGLRAIEICNLDLQHYFHAADRDSYALHVLGKGKKHRILKIPEGTLNLLKLYLEHEFGITGPDIPVALQKMPLFPHLWRKHERLTRQAIYKMVTRNCERAGQPHRTPHGYRHYFVSTGAQRGIPLDKLQRAAGHDDIRTTSIYVDGNEIFSDDLAEVHKDADKI